jgi:hypothetical protein
MIRTVLNGKKTSSGSFSVRSCSLHRQNVQRLVGLSCKFNAIILEVLRVLFSLPLIKIDYI